MGLVLRFTAEDRGQVEAIDTLIFAALVSISAVLIATYGVGSYHQDLHMQALQHRYAADFSQSFVMTSRYVSAGEGDIAYTIGPHVSDDSVFYSLSGIVNRSVDKSPLERSVKGSILDIIAEDLYLGLEFHSGNDSYPLNNWFLTSGFHEKVNDFVIENLDFFSGGMFYYRLEASYHPYDGTNLNNALYSEAIYTNARGVPNASVYVTEIIVAIPAVSEDNKGINVLSSFSEQLNSGLIKGLLPEQINVSGNSTNVTKVIEDLDDVLGRISETQYEVKRIGKVIIKIWPKAGGGGAERVL